MKAKTPAERKAEQRVRGRKSGSIVMYHGTTTENAALIRECGMIDGPVFLTPCKSVAENYADGGEVLEVSVSVDSLEIDLDLPGGRTLSFDDAKSYRDADWSDIHDAISDGVSMAVKSSIEV